MSVSRALVFAALLLAISACAVAGLGITAHYKAQHTLALQAQATIGHTASLGMLNAIEGVLAALAVLPVVGLAGAMYLVLRRDAGQKTGKGKWAPGPNAYWKRSDGTRRRSVRRCPGRSIARRLLEDEKPLDVAPENDGADDSLESLLAWWQQK